MTCKDSQDERVWHAGVITQSGCSWLIGCTSRESKIRDIIGTPCTERQGLGTSHFHQWRKTETSGRRAKRRYRTWRRKDKGKAQWCLDQGRPLGAGGEEKMPSILEDSINPVCKSRGKNYQPQQQGGLQSAQVVQTTLRRWGRQRWGILMEL